MRLGIDPDNSSDITNKVKFVAEEVENARLAAEDPVVLRLTAKKKKVKTEIEEKLNLLGKKKAAWSEQRLQEIRDNIRDLEEKVQDAKNLLNPESSSNHRQKKRQMLKRQA